MKQQEMDFVDNSRKILDVLVPVGIERWRLEGLFRKGQKIDAMCSVGDKIRTVRRLHSRAFDVNNDTFGRSEGGLKLSQMQLKVEKKDNAAQDLKFVHDTDMRKIMKDMIFQEELNSARYTARKYRMAWVQFVDNFNQGLEDIIQATSGRGDEK